MGSNVFCNYLLQYFWFVFEQLFNIKRKTAGCNAFDATTSFTFTGFIFFSKPTNKGTCLYNYGNQHNYSPNVPSHPGLGDFISSNVTLK